MIRQSNQKSIFIAVSLLCLISGILGVFRQSMRSAMPFEWKEEGNQIFVVKPAVREDTDEIGLEKDDVVLRLNGHSLKDGTELEYQINSIKAGECVIFDVKRRMTHLSLSSILMPRYRGRFIIVNALLGLFFWFIGFYTYLKKPLDRAAHMFGWGCLCVSVSVLLLWEGYPYDGKFIGYFLIILYFLLYPLFPAFLLNFTCYYPGKKQILQKFKWIPVFVFIPSVFFVVLLETTYLSSILNYSIVRYHQWVTVHNCFRIYFILYVLLSIACLFYSYIHSDNRESRNKTQWILWGISFGTAPFLILWTLPQVIRQPPFLSFEIINLFLMLIPVSFAISIIKYRMMDIELIINRSIVYSMVTGLIITLYLILVGISGYFFHAVSPSTSHPFVILFTIFAAISFTPLRNQVQNFVDKHFYRIKYNYRLAIQAFGKALSSALDADEVVRLLIQKINDVVPVKKMALVVSGDDNHLYTVWDSMGLTKEEIATLQFNSTDDFINLLDSKRIPMRKEWNYSSRNLAGLPVDMIPEDINVELVIPAVLQEKLSGFLLLGEKLSGKKFSEEDLDLLIPMVEESFLALDRLRLQESFMLERAEKKKLQELNELKSEFVAHVSHELRTPLTSMSWSIENLLDGIPEKPNSKVGTYLKGIQDSCHHLHKMIENLLDITKIEAGKIEMHPSRLKLCHEVKKSIEMIMPVAARKGSRLLNEVAGSLEVVADGDWLQAILINLLDNAVKYSKEGECIRIRAEFVKEDSGKRKREDEGMVVISVIDKGVGIPSEKQKTIFERFERLKARKSLEEKGLGLGLHIVKKLVELQKGKIWVESEVGKGSTFSFTLPVE